VRPSRNELETLTRKSKDWKRALIQVLQDIQDRFHWLPPEALEHVSAALGVPLVQAYGVATFCRSFSLAPRVSNNRTVRRKKGEFDTITSPTHKGETNGRGEYSHKEDHY
jgi:NADH:ubiquinone oxidoreductase subunit E